MFHTSRRAAMRGLLDIVLIALSSSMVLGIVIVTAAWHNGIIQ